MAITDPTQIFRTPLTSKKRPAVLATIATNGAFWAINHGSHGKIDCLRGLGVFERVIAYKKGTTSYNIAARIARDSGKQKPLAEFIQVVEPGKELLLLSDPNTTPDTVALSPDILHIEAMTNREDRAGKACFAVELPIGETQEFNDVVVAALMSNSDFVSRNPTIVQGVVNGIQRSLQLIHRRDPEILRFARSYFLHANKAEGALEKAITSGVIPQQVTVAKPHWMSAAKAYCEISDPTMAWPREDENKALQYFEACIQPYEAFTNQAVTTSEGATPERISRREISPTLGQFASAAVAIAITAYWGWIPASIIACGVILAWGISKFVKYVERLRIAFLAVLWLGGVFFTALPFIKKYALTDKKIELISLGIAFLIPAVWESINYAERGKK